MYLCISVCIYIYTILATYIYIAYVIFTGVFIGIYRSIHDHLLIRWPRVTTAKPSRRWNARSWRAFPAAGPLWNTEFSGNQWILSIFFGVLQLQTPSETVSGAVFGVQTPSQMVFGALVVVFDVLYSILC